jgi:hypothetical protein
LSQRYTSLRDGTPVVEIDATSGNETHMLTSGFTPGRQYIVIRLDGSANTVTVQAENGDTLNGTTNGSVAIPPRESVTFDRLDAAWRTVGFGGAEQGSGASIADGSITANKLGADVPAALAPDIAAELTLGDAATRDVGTGAGQVAAGDDSRITGAAQASDVTAALALKAPLASPTFSGTVTVPTGSGATDAAAFGQLPKHPDGSTVATVVPRQPWLDARDYGAVGDGTTDDTAALQSFVTAVVTGHARGYIPKGTYRITSALNISTQPEWSILGAGRQVTIIRQDTNNVPVINMGSDTVSYLHAWSLRDLSLAYANVQPAATNTNANCILFSQMPFNGDMRNLGFAKGRYGMKVASGIGAPWGCSFDDLMFYGNLTGGAIDMTGAVNAVPNNHWGRFTMECNTMVGPVFAGLRGYNFRIDTLEFLSANLGPRLMDFAAGASASIGALKLEVGQYDAGQTLFNFATNCIAEVDEIVIGGSTPWVFNVPSGQVLYIIGTGTSSTNGSRIRVGNLDVANFTSKPGAGTRYLCNASPNAPIVIGRATYGADWALHNNGSTTSGNWITVENYVNNRLSDDRGDADYTVTLADPNIINFGTAFTAQRTVTLPATGTQLHNGLYYEIVANGAINGANDLVIKAGATTLRTQTADKVVIRYTWRRHTTAASGWVMTKYETLP